MTAATSRHTCPVCDTELTMGAAKCPNCHTDMRLFAPSFEMARDFYDAGLDLARIGDNQGAIDKMRGALATDPNLLDAYIVLGKLLAQSGQTSGLEQAIACWERARGLRPTGEQSRKLDHCIETADARLRTGKQQAVAKNRRAFGVLIAGALVFAAVCGVAGYFLRPSHVTSAAVAIHPEAGTDRTGSGTANAVMAGPPSDPVAAITEALHRPDITVTRVGDKFALQGTVQSEAEKDIMLAAANCAAHTPMNSIDGSKVLIKHAVMPVQAKRVEQMLHLFVFGLGHGSGDPLHDASLVVSEGMNKKPLRVTGTCASPKARVEVAKLVKEIYPSANPVDVSGLVVHPIMVVRQVATKLHRVTAERRRAPKERLLKTPVVAMHRAVEHDGPGRKRAPGDQVYIDLSKESYTVQPGDSIYGITRKYGRDVAQWRQLWQANRQAIRNPDSIPDGTVLKLPPGWIVPKKAGDDN
jgi:nucleoid-associated protein YgaU